MSLDVAELSDVAVVLPGWRAVGDDVIAACKILIAYSYSSAVVPPLNLLFTPRRSSSSAVASPLNFCCTLLYVRPSIRSYSS